MPLDPLAQQMLEQLQAYGDPPLHELSVAEARKEMEQFAQMLGPGEAVEHVEDCVAPSEHGDIPLRIYRPAASVPLPILVNFHGGGWVLGSLDSDDAKCRALANAVGCAVVNVNYRHAPEHKFPAAAEDAYAATLWAAQNAASFSGDASRLAVAGASAGGNLAAVVSLMARERGAPEICFQVLSVPVTSSACDTESYCSNADGYVLTRASMEWFWNHYLSQPSDGEHEYASPLNARNFSDLPPAFIATAEYDPLRDEGEAYARALQDAGVHVNYKCYDGMLHVFQGPEEIPDIAAQLRAAFSG